MATRPFRYRVHGEAELLILIPGLDGLTEFFSRSVPELARHYRSADRDPPAQLRRRLGDGRPDLGGATAHDAGAGLPSRLA